MADEIAIKVENISKMFKLPHEKSTSIKSALINFYKQNKTFEQQEVLKNISFEIKKGEFFGIVGKNGGGKSTLLKLLAGIYTPNKGSISINGKLTPFIELGVGFNPELTGRENIYLNGALLGFSRKEMEEKYQDIVDFSEIERFIDQKLKNYSSGMQVRLAFSIAIRAQSDILLLDEVLAVGDEAFQRKCYAYFAELQRKKKTVVLVTHDMDAVKRFCSKALLINKGKIELIGEVGEVTKRYSELNREPNATILNSYSSKAQPSRSNSGVSMKVVLRNQNLEHKKTYYREDSLIFDTTIQSKKHIQDVIFGLTIQKSNGELVYWFTTEKPNPEIKSIEEDGKIHIQIQIDNIFGEGEYSVNASFKSRDRSKEYCIKDDIITFKVGTDLRHGWTLHPKQEVIIKK